jgi:hypothetical protein
MHYNRNNRGGNGGSGIVIIRHLKSSGTSTFNGLADNRTSLIFSMDPANLGKGLCVEVLVVGGGGGGGMDMGGGGGGGGVVSRQNLQVQINSPMPVTIGAGGNGSPGTYGSSPVTGLTGNNSAIGDIIAYGGGGGGSGHYIDVYATNSEGSRGNGGSAGGDSPEWGRNRGMGSDPAPLPSLLQTPQGHSGGAAGCNGDGSYTAGGGGGASRPGQGGRGSWRAGDGGTGFLSAINGTSYYWGGGGGGSSWTNTAGVGGAGGGGGGSCHESGTRGTGGAGINAGANGTAATGSAGGNGGANSGGGGGGGTHAYSVGGNGGSGIVIVRYAGSQKATGGTITSSGGYTIHTFTSSGTFTPTSYLDIYDLSPTGNKITLDGGAYYDSANMGGIVLDGDNDKIIVSLFTYTPRSLNIWLYNNNAVPGNDGAIGGPSTYQTLTSFGGGTPGVNLGGWTGSASNEAVHIWGNGTLTYTNQLVPVGFHNFVFNWNGTHYDIWIDGIKQTVIAGSGGHAGLVTYTANLYIGSDNGTYEFNGRIFRYDMYERSLTDIEIQQNFNALRGRFGI